MLCSKMCRTVATADSRWSAAWLAASTASSYGGRRRIQPVRRGAEQGAGELSARADTQLAEHFLQVVLDRVRADEQPGRDLAVGQAFRDEPGDPCLLGRELVDGLAAALADPLTGCLQLDASARREALGAHRLEHVVCDAQLSPRIPAAPLPTQPFPVEEVGAGQLGGSTGSLESLDGLGMEGFRFPS